MQKHRPPTGPKKVLGFSEVDLIACETRVQCHDHKARSSDMRALWACLIDYLQSKLG